MTFLIQAWPSNNGPLDFLNLLLWQNHKSTMSQSNFPGTIFGKIFKYRMTFSAKSPKIDIFSSTEGPNLSKLPSGFSESAKYRMTSSPR